MKIIRVFPRKTKATPEDENVRIGTMPGMFDDEADEIHISCTFTWDIPLAEELAKQWDARGEVKLGGPAMDSRGGEFEPGMYVKDGYVITSRGCPNKCWFCSVWRREGFEVRELAVKDGWNVLDDNLLACSEKHIRSVFDMLDRVRSPERRVQFTGGLEAARLQAWHVELLRMVKAKQLFFAYDTPDDLDPLQNAGRLLLDGGFTRASKSLRCYVLIGYPKDTPEAAEKRMMQALHAGFVPMAMYYRDGKNHGGKGSVPPEWHDFQWQWSRPAVMNERVKAVMKKYKKRG